MSEFENYKKKQLEEILLDADIKKVIDENHLSTSFVVDNFNTFNDVLESKKLCKNCKGLALCKQRKKGEYLGIEINPILNINVNHCDKFQIEEDLKLYQEKFIYSDIPNNLSNINLSNLEVDSDCLKQLFVECYEIFEGKKKKGLYIYGDFGTGKTYISIALANSLVQIHKKVAFINMASFATKASQLLRDEPYRYESLIKRISKAEYLFIDDLGTEIVSEFTRDRLLFNILNYRMENNLTTIITSNLDKKTLLKTYSKNQESLKANRVFERIDILTNDYLLEGEDKRRL